MNTPKKYFMIKRVVPILLLVLFLLYWILTYFLVSATLVPSFMKKLDAFDDITKKSYSEQVQTTDIKKNRSTTLSHTKEWYSSTVSTRETLVSTDGYTLVARQFRQTGNNWVLLLHGYTGWKEEMYEFACWYYEQGFNVLVPDLRCQGESEGDFIGMGWTDHYDCELWLEHILSLDSDANILIHGQSMGASTALILSGDENLPPNVKAVVSDCAYTDAYSMFGDKCKSWFHLPAFPLVDSVCLMLRLRGGYNLKDASAIAAVKNSQIPTLFVHGDEDAMISVRMAKELYESCSAPKSLLLVEGAGHAQSQNKDPENYYGSILELISNCF